MEPEEMIATQQQPHNKQAEEALLGSLLIDPQKIKEINITAEDFYIIRNRWIWEAMKELSKQNTDVDILTITEYLKKQNQLEEIGGQAYLVKLINQTPSSMNAESYANIIREKRQRRGCLEIASELAKFAYQEDQKIDEVIPGIMTALTKNSEIVEGAKPISAALDHFYEDLIKRIEDPKDIYGIPTGLTDLDYLTGGLQRGELTIVAGEPEKGKTKLMTQIIMQMAKNFPGAFYQMEMSDISIMRRIISSESGVLARPMKTGRLEQYQIDKIMETIGKIDSMNIIFSDYTGWNINSWRADIARLKNKYDIQWVALDYLYKMHGYEDHSEFERLGLVTRDLKSIARDFNVAIYANHSLIKPGLGDFKLSDMRGSMQIGYEADTAYFLVGDEKDKNLVHLLIKKFREDTGGGEHDEEVSCVTLRKKKGFPCFENYREEYKQNLPYND
jgi:replicative DNA helicase